MLLLGAYLAICRYRDTDPPDRLSHSKLVQAIYGSRNFQTLIRAATEEEGDRFNTTWDFNRAIGLSRSLFVPTTMFGQEKYRYRPHLRIVNSRVWTGFAFDELVLPASARMMPLLSRCHPARVVAFTTDRLGYKNDDAAYDAAGPPLLLLGDSFTEGLWVAPDATFTAHVTSLARQQGRAARVLNLGVDGYSALEERWTLEHVSTLVLPKVAVMNLFLNDVHEDYVAVMLDQPVMDYTPLFHELEEAVEFARQRGIAMIVSTIPAKEQFGEYRGRLTFQARVRNWCTAKHVKCLDPYTELDRHGGASLYFSWDPHFNERGHQAYGQFLWSELHDLF